MPPRRRRRSGEEVRSAILAAAEDLFAAQGFSATTTRAVARAAAVSEALVYTQFGSKTGLFEAAVVDRYETFVRDYMAEAAALLSDDEALAGQTHYEVVHGFVRSFSTFLTDNRGILLSYLDYHRQGPGQAVPPTADFALPLRGLEAALAEHGPAFGLRAMDVPLTVRLAISMVLTLVLHDDVLFAGMAQPEAEHIWHEATTMILRGIEARP